MITIAMQLGCWKFDRLFEVLQSKVTAVFTRQHPLRGDKNSNCLPVKRLEIQSPKCEDDWNESAQIGLSAIKTLL